MSQVAPKDGSDVAPTPRGAMTPRRRLEVFTQGKGRCARCGLKITPGEPWDANHKIGLFQGGADTLDNLEAVHKACHREITDDEQAPANAKIRRLRIKNGPPELRPAPTQTIQSRPFPKRWEAGQ